jgi:hypothetical protein
LVSNRPANTEETRTRDVAESNRALVRPCMTGRKNAETFLGGRD